MCIKNLQKADYSNKKTILELFDFYEDELYQKTQENKEYVEKISKVEKEFYNSLTLNQKN